MKKIFISILNFNGRKNTLECLRSLNNIRIADFKLEIVLVDNASREPLYLPENLNISMHLAIIKNSENLGFSGGQNVGFKYALKKGADYILVLNNDTLVDKLFLEKLFKVLEEDRGVGIAVPKIYFAKDHEFHKGKYKKEELGKVFWYAGGEMDWKNIIGYHRGVDEVDRGQFDKIEQTEIATGGCMLIRKDALERVGPFDEKYFLYYEDADLSVRVIKRGYKIMYVPPSVIWHKNASSAGGSGSKLQDYYISRNRLLFGFKYASLRSKIALLKESFGILFGGRKWQRKGVLDFYRGVLGKGSFKV